MQLLNKYFAVKGTPKELFIFSASAVDKLPGNIYVEAFQDIHVREACEGLMSLNKDYIRVIPSNEVHDVLSPDPKN